MASSRLSLYILQTYANDMQAIDSVKTYQTTA